MRLFPIALALISVTALQAQVIAPRADSYLFSANVEDARSLWVNPAGLGVLSEASLYGEMTMDRAALGGDWAARQYSFGLLSRQFGLGYQRDRGIAGGTQGTWRVGAAVPLGRRLAIGTGISFTSPERGIDVGLRVSPGPMLDAAAVVRNIGRPDVRGSKLPIVMVAGLASRFAQGRLGIQADAVATERPDSAAGFAWHYRGGISIAFPGKTPFSIFAAVRVPPALQVEMLSVGLSLGHAAQATVVGTSLPQASTTRIEALSVTAVARSRTTANKR